MAGPPSVRQPLQRATFTSGMKSSMSQSSCSPPLVALNAMFFPSGDQLIFMGVASRPVSILVGVPPAAGIFQSARSDE